MTGLPRMLRREAADALRSASLVDRAMFRCSIVAIALGDAVGTTLGPGKSTERVS